MLREPFAVGDSIIHRIDPRYKVVTAVLFTVTVAVSYRFATLLTALAVALILVRAARLQLREIAGRLAAVFVFLVLLWIVLPLTFQGPALAELGPLTLTRPGVVLAAQISIKSITILLCLIALTATMNFAALGHALDRLRVPGKIVHLLLMTYRYIFVIETEYRRLLRAAKIRGFRAGTNLHTYRTYAYMVGMLFVRAAARAERVYEAMRCRGFHGRFYCLSEFHPQRLDRTFAACMTAATAVLIGLEWGLHP
jgi:cobalt/nickel transport system permease protein